MRLNKKKSTALGQQSPPPDLSQASKNKNQKIPKEIASNISSHVKRAVEGISSKMDKGNIDKIISDSVTAEGCYYIMDSIINIFDHSSNNDSIVLKALEVLYILLQTPNTTFRTTAQPFMPEIISITTLNFKKSKLKFRNQVHELAKAIYLNLQSNKPLPTPVQLGLADHLSPFVVINVNRKKNNIINTENQNLQEDDNDPPLDFLNDTSEQKNRINLNDTNINISFDDMDNDDTNGKNALEADLIDCDNTKNDLIDCDTSQKHVDTSILSPSNTNDNPRIEIGDSFKYPSKAKQVFDDYLKKNGLVDEVPEQNSETNKSLDNLLLIPDDSFTASSNFYSSVNVVNNNSSKNNNNISDSNVICDNNVEINSSYDTESNSKPSRRPKQFKISLEKSEPPNSPNIPRSQSLRSNMPSIHCQNKDSNLNPQASNGQDSNLSVLIDPNQIIDLTKPSSTPNSPPGSIVDPKQNNYLDSILNSAPIKSPSHTPSTFEPPPNYELPDSTSIYNSEAGSSLNLNTNQCSSQLSKSNLMLNTSSNFNSNIGLNTKNSISDSILKMNTKEEITTSRTSGIPLLSSAASNLQISQKNSNFSFNTINSSNHSPNEGINPSISVNAIGNVNENKSTNNILNNNNEMSLNIAKKKNNSFHFNVQCESLKPQNQEPIIINENNKLSNNFTNPPQTKAKKSFRIEKKRNTPKKYNSINISPLDIPINSSFEGKLYSNSSNNPYLSSHSSNFSSQDLYGSSIHASTNDEDEFNFQSKPTVGLEYYDNQFELITPVQSGALQMPNENNSHVSPIVNEPPTLSNNDDTTQKDDKFDQITPVRTPIKPRRSRHLSDVGFEPLNLQNFNNSNNNDDNTEKIDENVFNNSQVSDDQFELITPVRKNSESFTNANNNDNEQFGPITPTKNQAFGTSLDDQFEPITPVKILLETFDDDTTNNNDDNNNIQNNIQNNNNDDSLNNSNNNNNSNDSGMFVPLWPSYHENTFSDDQFIPMSPTPGNLDQVPNNAIPRFSNMDLDGIPSNSKNIINNYHNISPRGNRRHISFDSGIQSFSNGSDRFEAITPPNARSMFILNNPSYKSAVDANANQSPKNDSENEMPNKFNDNSFSDQFEPITPPSSLQNRSQITDLLSSNEPMIPSPDIFNQNDKNDHKFDEDLDKQLNKNHADENHRFVSFEISKQTTNPHPESNGNQYDNFEPIDPVNNSDIDNPNANINVNPNIEITTDNFNHRNDSATNIQNNDINIDDNFESIRKNDILIDANKNPSDDIPLTKENVIDLRPVVPNNNNNSKRFSIKRTPSPQTVEENINN